MDTKIFKPEGLKFKNLDSKTNSINYFLQRYQRSNQDTCLVQRPSVFEGDWVEPGDLVADCSASKGGELSLGQNLLIGYMPWEGYNYEDAILISERLVLEDLYTSIHIEIYETETKKTKYGLEKFTNQLPDVSETEKANLDQRGIIKLGSFVQEGTILVGKVTPVVRKFKSPYQKLLYTILEKELDSVKDSSLRAPKGLKAKVINISILKTTKISNFSSASESIPSANPPWKGVKTEPKHIQIYLAEKRQIQIGDKMAGRHGNKGIVSQILPREDMPYLPDGTPLDMVLNPLGVPSRMNVGQIYECLLGLAAQHLGENYRISPFDEIFGAQASRSFVLSKLYEARCKTKKTWLLNPAFPGKIKLIDGRSGEFFDQPVTVGIAYMLKLVHLVDDKIHARSTGPYSLVTQQPLKGRSKYGGQRLGEMEVWALEAYGAAFTLLEMLTIKSDDITGRMTLWSNIILHNEIYIGTPESFKVLVCELQALCLDIGLYKINSKGSFSLVSSPNL
jgi:DNA-directed RNA polymerase subunit beta